MFVLIASSLVLSAVDIEPNALVVAADIPIVPVEVIVPLVIGADVAISITVPLAVAPDAIPSNFVPSTDKSTINGSATGHSNVTRHLTVHFWQSRISS